MPRWLFTSLLGIGGVSALAIATAPPSSPPTPLPAGGEPMHAQNAGAAGPLTVTADLDYEALVDGESTARNLVITVRGANDDTTRARTPVDLAVVVDTSGSMNDEGKFADARRAVHALAEQLTDVDRLALVTFSSFTSSPVALGRATESGPLAASLLDRTTPGGSTYLSGGLNSGFAALASVANVAGRVHRVLLMTDGRANQGIIDTAGLSELARSHDGVSVSTIGMGLDYDEGMLAAVADAGGGEYHYVGAGTDLAAVYASEIASASSVVATNVDVDIALPDGVHADRALSWTSRPADLGLAVRIGDLSAGQTRTIVIPVTVDASFTGNLASVKVIGQTPDGASWTVDVDTGELPRVAASAVEQYQVPAADVAATRALAGETVENARAAWNRGEEGVAKSLLSTGTEYVRRKSKDGRMDKRSSDTLGADLQALESMGYMNAAQGAKSASTVSRSMSR